MSGQGFPLSALKQGSSKGKHAYECTHLCVHVCAHRHACTHIRPHPEGEERPTDYTSSWVEKTKALRGALAFVFKTGDLQLDTS